MHDERWSEPTVERVERADGRYVIYFHWPDERPLDEPPPDRASADDE